MRLILLEARKKKNSSTLMNERSRIELYRKIYEHKKMEKKTAKSHLFEIMGNNMEIRCRNALREVRTMELAHGGTRQWNNEKK